MTTIWASVDPTNYLDHKINLYPQKIIGRNSYWKLTWLGEEKHTRIGFDQEKSAPDKASDTQSTGVPERQHTHIQL